MLLISDDYCQLNTQLHHENKSFGAKGGKWHPEILGLMGKYCTTDVLDYGAGKQSLKGEIPTVTSYDPAIPEISRLPDPHDIVACLDVLEHIEPEKLDRVVMHLFAVTKKVGVFVIATRKANKTLPDGRNTHLIVKSSIWWAGIIGKYFHITQVQVLRDGGELVLHVKPRRKDSDE